jgi:uridine kinase
MERKGLIESLGEGIYRRNQSHPLRVAIDGIDAAGKTSLADELAKHLRKKDREIIRASVDDFHNPAQIRKSKGDLSPDGYYQDSFNYNALIRCLLTPLGPGGNRLYQEKVFDLDHNRPVKSPIKEASQDAILIIDGIFLLRPELSPFWDLSIYLDISFKNATHRGALRDAERIGSFAEAQRRYRDRYVPGQKLYHLEANPLDKADILIDNNTLEYPEFIKVPPDF